MKKAILILLCFAMLVSSVSCVTKKENDNLDAHTHEDQTTVSDIVTPCTHILGEWSVSKDATEREDGEEKRVCSQCDYFETKLIHAKGTDGLSFTLSEDGTSYSVSAGSATEGKVFIPAYYNALPVTSIGYTDMDSEVEPETFEPGEYAFMNCTELKDIVVPPTIIVIGDMAFAGCESLENIVIPPSVTIIGDGAFALCKSLKSIVLPESVKEIGKFAFVLTDEDLFQKYYADIKVSIPNTQVIIILREWQLWMANGVEIYYLDENGNEILIADTYFIDEYCSFDRGYFEIINNNDNTFSVRAGASENKDKWMEKTFDIPQCVSVFVPKSEAKFTVFYTGNSIEEWNTINIVAEGLSDSLIYYYSETEPSESNKYWHYVDGVPTLW